MSDTLSFANTVRSRRSVRAFTPQPLADDVIRAVLEDAQWTPSNCNTQPWSVHIVTGAKRDAMSAALVSAYEANRYSPDFGYDTADYTDAYSQRQQAQGAAYYQALGISRDAYDERRNAGAANLTFFGAPQVAFLFMPAFGDCVRVASDIGMYAQTFLLALASRNLGGVPQTMLGLFADTVREQLGLGHKLKLLFGISFGHIDEAAPGNEYRIGREAVSESVVFHR